MTAMQGEIHGRWTKKCRPFQHTLVEWLCNTKIDYIMQLLCAVLAECFYTGASITFKAIKCNTIHILQHLPSIHFPLQESWWLPTQQGGTWPLDGSSLCINFHQCNASHFDLTSFPAWGGSFANQFWSHFFSLSSLRREQQHRTLPGLKCRQAMPPWPDCGSMSRR